jgi:uncharacterized protein (DUF305 family)
MGRAKLGSWWVAGAAVSLLISVGAFAESAAPVSSAGAAGESPAPVAESPAPVRVSRYNERGGGDQMVLMTLHRQNQQAIVDAQIAEERATTVAVRDYATTIISNRAMSDARMMNYASAQGMNLGSIRLGAGALPNGALTRVDLVNASPERFDHDFATKMVNDHQSAIDQTQKAQALARAPGMAAMLQSLVPPLMQQQADAMALVAALPVPPTPALQMPGQPPGVSRTNTGIDTRPGVAP